MKFSIDRLRFLGALRDVAAAVPSRTVKDILKNVRLDAAMEGVSVHGSDGDAHVISRVEALVSGVGTVLLPAGRLLAAVGAMTGDFIAVTMPVIKPAKDGSDLDPEVTLQCDGATFVLAGVAPEDFVKSPQVAEKPFFVSAQDLHRSLRQVIYATDTESTQYALGGVQFDVEGTTLNLVATDSRRLAVAKCLVVNAYVRTPVVLGARGLYALLRVLEGGPGELAVTYNADHAFFVAEDVTVVVPVIQGKFPDWRKVWPTVFQASFSVAGPRLLEAMKQTAVFSSEEDRRTAWHVADGTLRLECQHYEAGRCITMLPVINEGSISEIGFDSRYFIDFLNEVGEADVVVRISGEENPSMISTWGCDCVVMPLSNDRVTR